MTMNKEVALMPTRHVPEMEPPPFVKPPGPSLVDTFAAGFRIESTVVAAFKAISDSQVEATDVAPEGYDQFDDIEGTIFEEWPDALIGVRTPDDKVRAEARLREEIQDRELLHQSGILGFIAIFAAGMLDPFILVPVGGGVKAVRSAMAVAKMSKTAKAAQLGKIALTGRVPAEFAGPLAGGIVTARAAMLGSTAAEIVLQSTQDTRTYGEGVLNITASMFLGSLLGAGVGQLSVMSRQRALAKIEDDFGEPGIVGGGSEGAGVRITESDLVQPTDGSPSGADVKLANSLGFDKLATMKGMRVFMAPVVRVVGGSLIRHFKIAALKISDSPVRTEGLVTGSSVESAIMQAEIPLLVRMFKEKNRLWIKYRMRMAKESGGGTAFIKQGGPLRVNLIRAMDGVTQRTRGTKLLTPAEFSDLAGVSWRTRDSGIPEVDEFGVWIGKNGFEPLLDDLIRVGLLPEEVGTLGPVGQRNYLTRSYLKERLLLKEDTFKEHKIKPWLRTVMDDEEIDSILNASMMKRIGDDFGGKDGLSVQDVQDLAHAYMRSTKAGSKKLDKLIDERELFSPIKAGELKLKLDEIIRSAGKHPTFDKKPKIPERPGPAKAPSDVDDEGISALVRRTFTAEQRATIEAAIDVHTNSIFENLTATTRGRMQYGRVQPSSGSPFKARALTWDDENLTDFLEQNIEILLERYMRTVVPDIAFLTKFPGDDLELSKMFEVGKQEYILARKAAKTGDERRKIQDQQKEDIEQLTGMIAVLRGTYAIPSDSGLVTFARGFRLVNFASIGGGFGLNAIPDVAMIPMRNGIIRSFRTGYMPMI